VVISHVVMSSSITSTCDGDDFFSFLGADASLPLRQGAHRAPQPGSNMKFIRLGAAVASSSIHQLCRSELDAACFLMKHVRQSGHQALHGTAYFSAQPIKDDGPCGSCHRHRRQPVNLNWQCGHG
jgi:hypothetical protein